MSFATINGSRLYYEVHGSGFPVVLAHGGASNHISWYQQVVALRDRYSVVTYDQRGFGFSEENGDLEASAVEDLRGLVDHLGHETVGLLGQSLGGAVVAGFTSRYPERVKALVLSSTPGGLVDNGRRPPSQDEPLPSYVEMATMMVSQDDFKIRHPALHFLVEEICQMNSRVDVRRLNATFYGHNEIGPIAEAKIPLLLINGADDPRGTTGVMAKIQEQVPGSTLVTVPGGGHLVYLENPDPYNEQVLAFLSEHLGG